MIKVNDTVEVLPNPVFFSLVGNKGIVRQKIGKNFCVVEFAKSERWFNLQTKEAFVGRFWNFLDKHLRVIDSPEDDRVGALEEQILSLEDDLLIARACLATSEELRDRQFDLLESMKEEIDNLKMQLYHARNGN